MTPEELQAKLEEARITKKSHNLLLPKTKGVAIIFGSTKVSISPNSKEPKWQKCSNCPEVGLKGYLDTHNGLCFDCYTKKWEVK